MMLNKRQRNKIYDNIVDYELDPREFDLEDTGNRVMITHKSGSTLEIVRKNPPEDLTPFERILFKGYETKMSVTDGISETYDNSDPDSAISEVRYWLREIQLTVGVPDHWEEMRRSRELVATIGSRESANSAFTQDEQRQIAAHLQAIKVQVREQFELTSEQIAQVNEKLDEVVEASERLGRKDWLIYFLGTITALIIASTVTSGVGEHIFTMVIQSIAHMFIGGTEPPPPLPPNIIS